VRIVTHYSHLNGLEFLLVHKPQLWEEITGVIRGIDAIACRTKISKEKRTMDQVFYSPIAMNDAMSAAFAVHHWSERRTSYWVTSDAQLIRKTMHMPAAQQKAEIEGAGFTPIFSYNQTDFVKDRVAVEVQFWKYSFVAYDLFVKHMAFFVGDVIDVGIEILPMKELQGEMSSGVAYYEGELYNLIREGRGVPGVPLILVGVAP
jgi:hypothetical protein